MLIHGKRLHLEIGGLFFYKLGLAAVILLACLVIFRPFCKYLCPLGAIYALTNRFSLYRMHLDAQRCSGCGACASACPMQTDPAKKPNGAECIRCGACVRTCPSQALHLGVRTHPLDAKKEKTT